MPRHHSYEDSCSHSVVKRVIRDFSGHPVYNRESTVIVKKVDLEVLSKLHGLHLQYSDTAVFCNYAHLPENSITPNDDGIAYPFCGHPQMGYATFSDISHMRSRCANGHWRSLDLVWLMTHCEKVLRNSG
ncbi:hypothetical protein AVEN_204938-1 [Araneus ventricosus]|uniref:Uncharacterized protein n=1 Tax=Araneus ventricosus TaxID=182803 RepID=A0A4Y2SUZ8_ARAVE|nr:hypothetical protein AVEN_271320-1 [Araneus ventricosus]GBN92067.1 hypothetical protein AVEN_204938-1 [Araneus ventricosus]